MFLITFTMLITGPLSYHTGNEISVHAADCYVFLPEVYKMLTRLLDGVITGIAQLSLSAGLKKEHKNAPVCYFHCQQSHVSTDPSYLF